MVNLGVYDFLNANVPQSKIVSSTAWQLICREVINFYLHCQIYNSSLQIIKTLLCIFKLKYDNFQYLTSLFVNHIFCARTKKITHARCILIGYLFHIHCLLFCLFLFVVNFSHIYNVIHL